MNRPPPWAAFFDAPRWSRFASAVAADLDQRGVAHTMDGDAGCVRLADGRILGLTNIAQMCFQAPEDKWAYLVHHHFGLALIPPDEDADAMAKDFARARTAVKLRLWERSQLPKVPLVAWDVADDLAAVLTYDLPQITATVKRTDAEQWPISKADLWHLGIANVRRDGILAAPAALVGDGAAVHVLEGDSTYFAASHLLFLDAYTGPAPLGAIAAVPRRHTAAFHVIQTNRGVVSAIQSMLNVVPQMCFEGPGSITPSLYWWRPGGALMLLPATRGGDTVQFTPPPPFVEMLNRLR